MERPEYADYLACLASTTVAGMALTYCVTFVAYGCGYVMMAA